MNAKLKLHNQNNMPKYYIGKVAEITGASHKAIRYYEAMGLIPEPARKGRYRIYSELDIFLIHMIKTAQTVGFTLAEMKGVVNQQISSNQFPLKYANLLFDKKKEALVNNIEEIELTILSLKQLQEEMNQVFNDSLSSKE